MNRVELIQSIQLPKETSNSWRFQIASQRGRSVNMDKFMKHILSENQISCVSLEKDYIRNRQNQERFIIQVFSQKKIPLYNLEKLIEEALEKGKIESEHFVKFQTQANP